MSSKVYVRKSFRDINPLTGDRLSMLRLQGTGHDISQGIPASQIPVPYSSIDYENVVDPRFRFPVGKITPEPRKNPGVTLSSATLDEYNAALERAEQGDYPKLSSVLDYDPEMAAVFSGYRLGQGGDRGDTIVEPGKGLFFTPGNLQDIGSAEVTSTYGEAPARLVGVTSDPLGGGIDIRPPAAQHELLNEVFVGSDIPGREVFDLTPAYTFDRDYNPSWYNRGMDPADAYREEREALTLANTPSGEQIQAVANILNTHPRLHHRTFDRPSRFDERAIQRMIGEANKVLDNRRLSIDPNVFQHFNPDTNEMEYLDPGPMLDFLREKVNLRPMDSAYRALMERARMKPNFRQRTAGAPRDVVSQTQPFDVHNLQDEESDVIPPEFVDIDPMLGLARQGVDVDELLESERRKRLPQVTKSDTSISLESLDPHMGYEPCSCCSPMQQASMALLDGYFEKAKKKSKPFHGYNPKRHHKKGGLNAADRAKFKRETGANLKPPVTTKPSKLKPGSKRAKRRKSFCARMSGSKGPTSKDGKLTPKGAALKRWNC